MGVELADLRRFWALPGAMDFREDRIGRDWDYATLDQAREGRPVCHFAHVAGSVHHGVDLVPRKLCIQRRKHDANTCPHPSHDQGLTARGTHRLDEILIAPG